MRPAVFLRCNYFDFTWIIYSLRTLLFLAPACVGLKHCTEMRINPVLMSVYRNLKVDTPLRSVQLISLDRPNALNALNRELMAELDDVLQKTQSDNQIKCVVLTGSEKAFAGAYLSSSSIISDNLSWGRYQGNEGHQLRGRIQAGLLKLVEQDS